MSSSWRVPGWKFFLLCLVCASAASAQTTGILQGSVADEQGGALPGATVVLTDTETGWTRSVVTDAQGWYRAAALPPGVYEIKAELSGFTTAVRHRVPLALGQELTVNMGLKVAALAETVTVTASSPLVETSTRSAPASAANSSMRSRCPAARSPPLRRPRRASPASAAAA
jgi:Carboxypeptidase regulatory-like domain